MIQAIFIKYPGRISAIEAAALEEKIKQKLMKINDDNVNDPFVLVLDEGITAKIFTTEEVYDV